MELEELELFLQLAQDLRITGLEDRMVELQQEFSLSQHATDKARAETGKQRNKKVRINLTPKIETTVIEMNSSNIDEAFDNEENVREPETFDLFENTVRETLRIATEDVLSERATVLQKDPIKIENQKSGFEKKVIDNRTYRKMHKDIPDGGVDASPGTEGLRDWKERQLSLMVTKGNGFQCNECQYESNENHVREHVEMHMKGFYFRCPHCELWAPSKRYLRRHKASCKKDLEQRDTESIMGEKQPDSSNENV